MLTSFIATVACLSKLRYQRGYIIMLNSRLYSDFTSFYMNVFFFFFLPGTEEWISKIQSRIQNHITFSDSSL